MNNMDGLMKRLIVIAIILIATVGCGKTGTDPLTSAHFEERWLGMGHANETYRYAEALQREGRYREALAAYNAAEKSAYTEELRRSARQRRFYLQEFIKANEQGRVPSAPPLASAPPSDKPKAKATALPAASGTGSQAGQLQPLTPATSLSPATGSGSQAGQLQPLLPPYPPVTNPAMLPPSPPIVEKK